MYGLSKYAEKLKVQNSRNSIWNCVQYMYEIFWICKKIEHPKLHKFDRKLCTLYLYKTFGYVEKLNVQNCVNSTENCVQYMYGMSGFAEKLNVQICENSMRNCACYMCGMLGLAGKLHIRICKNSTGICVHFQYGISVFAEKLNIPNFENSTEYSVHYIRTERLDLQKSWLSRTAEIELEVLYVICT